MALNGKTTRVQAQVPVYSLSRYFDTLVYHILKNAPYTELV